MPGTRDGSGTVCHQERPGCLGNREGDPKEESTQEGGGRQKEKRWSVV